MLVDAIGKKVSRAVHEQELAAAFVQRGKHAEKCQCRSACQRRK